MKVMSGSVMLGMTSDTSCQCTLGDIARKASQRRNRIRVSVVTSGSECRIEWRM